VESTFQAGGIEIEEQTCRYTAHSQIGQQQGFVFGSIEATDFDS